MQTIQENDCVMSCQKHGDLSREQAIKAGKLPSGNQAYKCKICRKANRAKHYDKHKESVKRAHRIYREQNRDKYLESKRRSSKKWRDEHPDLHLAKIRKWDKENSDRKNENNRKSKKQLVLKLADSYVKELLCKHGRFNREDVTKELLQIKRAVLQIKRIKLRGYEYGRKRLENDRGSS
jgi:hypothetical protein